MTQQQMQEFRSCVTSAISSGKAKIKALDLTTRGTPRKRQYNKLIGLTLEQKTERHRAQMRDYHRRKQMSIDSANQIINEQEEALAELKHKLLDMEDARDMAIGKALNLLTALQRIECCWRTSEGPETIGQIARNAIDDFQGK